MRGQDRGMRSEGIQKDKIQDSGSGNPDVQNKNIAVEDYCLTMTEQLSLY